MVLLLGLINLLMLFSVSVYMHGMDGFGIYVDNPSEVKNKKIVIICGIIYLSHQNIHAGHISSN